MAIEFNVLNDEIEDPLNKRQLRMDEIFYFPGYSFDCFSQIGFYKREIVNYDIANLLNEF